VLNPPISLDPPVDEQFWGGWRWYKEFGGGLMTDWGAHMMDIAQWGLGVDRSGPVKITPAGYEGAEFLTYEYASGVPLTIEPFKEDTRGVRFIGSDGWLEVARGYFNASDESMKPEVKKDEVAYEAKSAHHENFIRSVMTRKDPVVPVEIGHRSATACNLGNIAYWVGRSIRWDPDKQTFVNDPEAEKYFSREYLNGYNFPVL
jgi:predicted dehydrogenase